MSFRIFAFAASLLLASGGLAHAHEYRVGQLQIDHPWTRATVPGQPAGGGFLTLKNDGPADRLLAVKAHVSETTELHTMSMEQNIMRMRQVQAIDLPAGKTVALAPGGLHIMFLKLRQPLVVGSTFPATLVFEKAGEVKVEFKVEPPGHGAGKSGHGDHGGHAH